MRSRNLTVVPFSFVLNRYFVVAGTLRPNNCPLVSIRLATATAPPVVGASLGCCWEGMAGRLVALHNVCPPHGPPTPQTTVGKGQLLLRAWTTDRRRMADGSYWRSPLVQNTPTTTAAADWDAAQRPSACAGGLLARGTSTTYFSKPLAAGGCWLRPMDRTLGRR